MPSRCGRGFLTRVRLGAFFFALDGNPQRAQKVKVVLGECSVRTFGVGLFALFGRYFIQANRGLQHQQHIEAMLADILHHSSDLFALDDRLMDSLAQLLNQFTQTRCHKYLQERQPTPETSLKLHGIYIPYFPSGPRATRRPK